MKVYISNYRNHWYSPYRILEKVLFWKDWDNIDYDTPWVEKWSRIINPFSEILKNILDFVHPRIEYIKIDRYDTWNMDSTLALIILPMLKQLKEDKAGAPLVDDEDVPEELRSTSAPPKEHEYDTDANHFKRWDWVMDEMIWTFEQLQPDCNWDDQYHSGVSDIKLEKIEGSDCLQMVKGPNDTSTFDIEGYKAHSARIDNGLVLFGKYYRGLWS
jgi:hypothetical protein